MNRCPLVLSLAIAAFLASWIVPARAGHRCSSESNEFGRCGQHGRCTRPKLEAPRPPRHKSITFGLGGILTIGSSLAETDADVVALFSRNRQMTKMYSQCAIKDAAWESWSLRLNDIMEVRATQHAGAAVELQQAQEEAQPTTAPSMHDLTAVFESLNVATRQFQRAMQDLEESATSLGDDARERVEERSRRSMQILDDVVAATSERKYAAGVLPRGGEPRGDPEALSRLQALEIGAIDFASQARALLAEQ